LEQSALTFGNTVNKQIFIAIFAEPVHFCAALVPALGRMKLHDPPPPFLKRTLIYVFASRNFQGFFKDGQ
jgi:hypothetical protein